MNITIIKIGGNVIDDASALNTFLKDFASIHSPKVLVHGGGKLATSLSTRLGLETQMIAGRRVTDAETLKIITMTYAGWINKSLVASLNALGCLSAGWCGADASLYPAVKRVKAEVDYGWVGDLDASAVKVSLLEGMFQQGITPVLAPVSSDQNGQLLNVNADTIAQHIALALCRQHTVQLVYCFEKNGLLNDVLDNDSLVPSLSSKEGRLRMANGLVSGGMIPKLENAIHAVESGVEKVWIGHSGRLRNMINEEAGAGTCMVK